MVFYDQHGHPLAYSEDRTHIYLFSGEPVAYLDGDVVYGYNGKHYGWFVNGWIRDLNGYCVFYTEDAAGGPAKPARQARPARSARYARPAKAAREARHARTVFVPSWSGLSGVQFFKQ